MTYQKGAKQAYRTQNRQTFLPGLTLKKPVPKAQPAQTTKTPTPKTAAPAAVPVAKSSTVQVVFESPFVDPEEGKSWAAELHVNGQGKVTRSFINVGKIWRNFKPDGRRFKLIFNGDYKVGTILEVALASSKENNMYGRNYKLVTPSGLKDLGNVNTDTARKAAADALGVPKLEWAFN
jgi:hypothetical protein